MSEHSENVSKQAVEAIQAAAKRACDDIREDAQKMISDLGMRAEALYQLEIEENGRFIGKGDHLFATEISFYANGLPRAPLSGAAIHFTDGARFPIGSGPVGLSDGPKLERGKRYRMIVAFQELKEEQPTTSDLFAEAASSTWANRSHVPPKFLYRCRLMDNNSDLGPCDREKDHQGICASKKHFNAAFFPEESFADDVVRVQTTCGQCRKADCKAADPEWRHCVYCWVPVAGEDLGGECGAWCPKCVAREANREKS